MQVVLTCRRAEDTMPPDQLMSDLNEGLTAVLADTVDILRGYICYQNAAILTACCFVYCIFFVPINLVYNLEDCGWLTREDCRKNKRHRKIGNLPPVYPNGWFAVAESSDIKAEEVKHVAVLGENLAVFRTKEGRVHILDAYCPHLGANMGVAGKVRGDCLECPFHLWKFNGQTGVCTFTPSTEKVPKSAKVKKWHSHECNDYIFVWYHAEGEEPCWYPKTFEEVKQYSYSGRNQFQINTHIQDIPENGSDLTHFTALHEAAVFTGGDLRSHESRWLRFIRHKWSSHWEAGTTPEERHLGRGRLLHNTLVFGRLRLAFYDIEIYQTGPGFVVLKFTTSVGPLLLLQSVTPTEPLLQTVVHRIYSPTYLAPYAKLILYSESLMFKRDVMVWNSKMYMEKPVLTKDDTTIARYRRWFSQFYSEHSPTYRSATQGYDW